VNFLLWKQEVEAHGLAAIQKIPGYHDERLRGKLQGVRSIRLGLGYRAYYRIDEGVVRTLIVEEGSVSDGVFGGKSQ